MNYSIKTSKRNISKSKVNLKIIDLTQNQLVLGASKNLFFLILPHL